MKIVDATWTPSVNLLLIRCSCGNEFWHRADRWHVKCAVCGFAYHLTPLRLRWRREHTLLSKEVSDAHCTHG